MRGWVKITSVAAGLSRSLQSGGAALLPICYRYSKGRNFVQALVAVGGDPSGGDLFDFGVGIAEPPEHFAGVLAEAGRGRRKLSPGVAEKATGIAVVSISPSEGCSTCSKNPVSAR